MPSRFNMTVVNSSGRAGTPDARHQLELEAAPNGEQGELRCWLDGGEATLVNWVRIQAGLYSILLDGRSYEVRVAPVGGTGRAQDYAVRVGSEAFRVALNDPRSRRRGSPSSDAAGPREILAPMPGKIVKLLVKEGEPVAEGQGLLVMEAMKMQNELRAPRAGCVGRFYAAEGAGVETGAPLLRLD